MTINLYSIGMLAELLDIDHRKLRHWALKAEDKLGYVPPFAVVPKHNKGKEVLLKLWHPDQVDAVKEGWAKYRQYYIDQAVAAKTRKKEYQKVYSEKYYVENKAFIKEKSKKQREREVARELMKQSEEAQERMRQRSEQEIAEARQLEIDAAWDAEQFIQQEQREREERAMQFLLEKNLV